MRSTIRIIPGVAQMGRARAGRAAQGRPRESGDRPAAAFGDDDELEMDCRKIKHGALAKCRQRGPLGSIIEMHSFIPDPFSYSKKKMAVLAVANTLALVLTIVVSAGCGKSESKEVGQMSITELRSAAQTGSLRAQFDSERRMREVAALPKITPKQCDGFALRRRTANFVASSNWVCYTRPAGESQRTMEKR